MSREEAGRISPHVPSIKLEIEFDLRSELGSHRVEQVSVRWRRDIVLNVAGIEMAGDIEDLESGPQCVLPVKYCHVKRPYYLNVQRSKGRKALAVTLAHKIKRVIYGRVWKSTVHVKHGPELNLRGQS